jgi:PPM family protein phosphatase
VYLICSDGLTTMVDDADILELLEANHDDLPKAAKALVAAANRRGGEDNITVVAFRIDAPVAEPKPELAETQTLPALDDTLTVPAPEAASTTEPAAARMRLALTMAGLLALAAILLVWGLVH